MRAGRRPREALGERPGNARERDHQADALHGKEPLRPGDQRHAEGDDERRDVDEDDHARGRRELQADEDAEELGAEQRAREQAALERAVAREEGDAASTGPQPDQDAPRRPSAASPARAQEPPAAPPSRQPGSGPTGSSRGRGWRRRRYRGEDVALGGAVSIAVPLLRKGALEDRSLPASLPSLREGGADSFGVPFRSAERLSGASSLRPAAPSSRRRRDRWRGRRARWRCPSRRDSAAPDPRALRSRP